MPKGVSIQLHDAAGAPLASVTGIQALWWDVKPENFNDPQGKTMSGSTDASGYLFLDLDEVSGLSVGDYGYLLLYKPNTGSYNDSPTFFGRHIVSTITSGADMYYYDPEWTRPADWLTLPVLAGTEQTVHLLVAVEEDPVQNGIAFTVSGAYTVDWGDGVTEDFANGVTATHQYDFADADLAGTLTSEGFKQAIITITPQSGQNLTSLDLQVKYLAAYATDYCAPILDMEISMPNATSITTSAYSTVVKMHRCIRVAIRNHGSVTSYNSQFVGYSALREVILPNTSAIQSFSYCFWLCSDLIAAPRLDMSAATLTSYMFNACHSLKRVPKYALGASCTDASSMFYMVRCLRAFPGISGSGVTTASGFMAAEKQFLGALEVCGTIDFPALQDATFMFIGNAALKKAPAITSTALSNTRTMFYQCSALTEVPLYNTGAVTDFTTMFYDCRLLTKVPTFNTSAGTTFTSMFHGCTSLQSVPALDLSAGTVFTNMVANCKSLSSFLATGARYSLNFSNNTRFSSAMLNTIYTNLGTAVGAQAINVTGNFGNTGDNPTIATAKGWTVTG